MRYAFMAEDQTYSETYVTKLPMKISPKSYTLDHMRQDLESLYICKLIVEELNERLVSTLEASQLVEFVQAFIYEITTPGAPFKYYYGETYIPGVYEKYNNNAGWHQNSKQALLAQTLSHFSWQLTYGYMMIVDL